MASPPTSERDTLVRAVEEDVAALTQQVAHARPESIPLDRTYSSLDRLEDFYRLQIATPATPVGSSAELDSRLASYVGATLVQATGGIWEPPRTKADMNRPGVGSLPGLGRAHFYPIDVVRTFKRFRTPGYMRDTTELYDIPLRRANLDDFVANIDRTLVAWRDDLRRALGRDPGPLDGGRESLAMVDEALKQLMATNASRDLNRRVEIGAVASLGQIVQRAVGGEWTLCEDPKDGDFGQLHMHGWAPMSVIRNVGPDSRPNLLEGVLDLVIKGRSTT
jgi:hypothetical protein